MYTGEDLEKKFSAARVAIAGAGGIGSHTATALVRAGVAHIKIVDFDVVDTTNPARQIYTKNDIGRKKVEALHDVLLSINPSLDLQISGDRITPQNVFEHFGGYPIICEAFDHPEEKAMLINCLLSADPPPIVISVSGMAGLYPANTIRTRQAMRNLYICGDEESDIASGEKLFAPRVLICAGHQANMVLRLLSESELPEQNIMRR